MSYLSTINIFFIPELILLVFLLLIKYGSKYLFQLFHILVLFIFFWFIACNRWWDYYNLVTYIWCHLGLKYMTFYGMLALIVLPKFVKCNKTAPLLMHLLNSGGQRHTHFIFRVGNTITLEDVAILLGVRIHGVPVIGSTNPNTIAL